MIPVLGDSVSNSLQKLSRHLVAWLRERPETAPPVEQGHWTYCLGLRSENRVELQIAEQPQGRHLSGCSFFPLPCWREESIYKACLPEIKVAVGRKLPSIAGV